MKRKRGRGNPHDFKAAAMRKLIAVVSKHPEIVMDPKTSTTTVYRAFHKGYITKQQARALGAVFSE